MKKTWHRLLLDLILLVGLATFYSDKIISMAYHEIGALVLFGLFILHLIFNHKWIRGVFGKIFSRKMPLRTRIVCILDVLLLLSWTMVIVSGACISKVVFSFRVMGQWKMLHFFFAALSLILSGIHLGMHVKYLGANLKKLCPVSLPRMVKKILLVVLSAVIVILGAVNYADFGLHRWLSMPFAVSAVGGPSGEMGRGAVSAEPSEEPAAPASSAEPASETSAAAASGETALAEEPAASAEMTSLQASAEPEQEAAASGEGSRTRASREMGPSGEMGGGARLGRVLALVWQIGSVVLALMTLTGWVDHLCLWAKGRIRAGKAAKSAKEET